MKLINKPQPPLSAGTPLRLLLAGTGAVQWMGSCPMGRAEVHSSVNWDQAMLGLKLQAELAETATHISSGGEDKPKQITKRRGRKPGSPTKDVDTRLFLDWKAANSRTGITKSEFVRERGLPRSALAAIDRGRKNVQRDAARSGQYSLDTSRQDQEE